MPRSTACPACLAAALVAVCGAAHADGTFLQLDAGRDTQTLAASAAWGRFGAEAVASHYDDGRNAGAAVSYSFPLGDVATLRIGPSVGWDDDDGTEWGAKLALDRYISTSFGGIYLLADANSIDNARFAMGQISHGASGFGVELSSGHSDSYHDTTLALQKRFGDSDFSLRAGYRFDSEQAFLGFSINTF